MVRIKRFEAGMPKHVVTALFAGIGGMELGLHRSGHRTSLFCECDPEAAAVLDARFSGVPLHFDVRETASLVEQIDPRSDLLTAGFPCTDLSQAGLMKGFDGPQSGLVRKVFDLLDARPFPNVLIENVPNWRVLHGGQYLTEVVEGFEARGYKWAYRTIDARAFGLPQRRLRVFLFASKTVDPRSILFHGNETPDRTEYGLKEAPHGFYWTEGTRGLGWGEDCVPTLKGGSGLGIPAPPAVLLPSGRIVTPTIQSMEGLQGFPADWTSVEERLTQHGRSPFKQRRRWHLVGNAVNVEVSAWLGSQLRTRQKWAGEDGEVLGDDEKWPVAAWFDGRRRRGADLTTWPVAVGRAPLHSIVDETSPSLSLRATEGFYKRISASSLRFKPGFANAVARHLKMMERGTRAVGAHKVVPLAAE